jgi:PST family polysaccharide transporter
VQAAINVAAAIVTVRWGIFWTALGVTLRQYLVWPLRLYIVRRHIGIEIQTYMRPWLTAVGATAVMVGILLMIREIASDAEALGVLAILGAAGAFSYVAIMQLVAASTVQEIRRLVRR